MCARSDRSDSESVGAVVGGNAAELRDLPPVIGRFRLVRCIATGGMGAVYEALQDEPQRPVALKIIRPELATPSMLRRFHREAEFLARLHHPCVAQIYEAGIFGSDGTVSGNSSSAEGVPYLALEFVADALPLTEYADRHTLDVDGRLMLFAQVCDAVQHGHEKGVIHRDLKPSNVLVDGDGRVKVIDFGVARLAEPDSAEQSLATMPGQFVGTVQYMSPEQIRAEPDAIDTRSDVYTLGVVLYELLSGRPPHNVGGRTLMDAARVVTEERPAPFTLRGTSRSGDLGVIISKAMSSQRERRYASAAELGADVRRFLNREAIMARPTSLIHTTRYFARRHRAAFIAALALPIIVFAGATISTWMYQNAELARLEAAKQAENAAKRLKLARDGADLLLFGVCNELHRVLGARELQLELTNHSMQHYRLLMAESPGDIQSERAIYNAFRLLGTTYEALGKGEEGTAATQLYLERVADCYRRDPTSQALRFDYALSRMSAADLADRENDGDGAIAMLEQGIAIQDELCSEFPNDEKYMDGLTMLLEYFGERMSQRDNIERAMVCYRRRHEIAERLAQLVPDSPRYQQKLALSFERMGDMAVRLGRIEEAAAAFDRELAIFTVLNQENPTDPLTMINLGVCYMRVGDLAADSGRQFEARQWFERKLNLDEHLHESEPRNPEYCDSLVVSLSKLVRAEINSHDLDSATTHLKQMHELIDELEVIQVDRRQTLGRESIACELSAALAESRGDQEQVLKWLTRKLEIDESLVARDPRDRRARDQLAVCLSMLGDNRLRSGAVTVSADYYERMKVCVESLLSADPNNVRYREMISVALGRLGEAKLQLGDRAAGITLISQAISELEWLAASVAENVDYHQRLQTYYIILVQASSTAQNTGLHRETSRKLIQLARALADVEGASADALNTAAYVLLICEYPDLRDNPAALRYAEVAIERPNQERNPAILDTLALAYFHNGRVDEAIRTELHALELVEDHREELRAELETNLALFQSAQQKAPSDAQPVNDPATQPVAIEVQP